MAQDPRGPNPEGAQVPDVSGSSFYTSPTQGLLRTLTHLLMTCDTRDHAEVRQEPSCCVAQGIMTGRSLCVQHRGDFSSDVFNLRSVESADVGPEDTEAFCVWPSVTGTAGSGPLPLPGSWVWWQALTASQATLQVHIRAQTDHEQPTLVPDGCRDRQDSPRPAAYWKAPALPPKVNVSPQETPWTST